MGCLRYVGFVGVVRVAAHLDAGCFVEVRAIGVGWQLIHPVTRVEAS